MRGSDRPGSEGARTGPADDPASTHSGEHRDPRAQGHPALPTSAAGGEHRDPRAQGHRALPHTADARLEAWGPTREACFAEAVSALAELYVEPPPPGRTTPVPVAVAPGEDADQLVRLLDEALFVVEVEGVVPVRARLTAERGGLSGSFDTVPLAEAPQVGSVPKAVTRHDLRSERREDGSWWCRVTVDV